jgi:hypothetical protein
MKLPKGTLKIIAINPEAAKSNTTRARAGSARLKPVWRVYMLNDDGTSFSTFDAFNFRASSLLPRHEPLGLRAAYPHANSAMRKALEVGVWFETRSEITLATAQETPAAEEITQETSTNG